MKRWTHLGAALLAACTFQAFAQNYPTKPVRLIIAFTPGSSTDIIGRAVAAKLQEMWGQPVVAENRTGAGGSIGSAAVLREPPDGEALGSFGSLGTAFEQFNLPIGIAVDSDGYVYVADLMNDSVKKFKPVS